MIRFLVLIAVIVLVVIAFRMGRQSEHGRLIDLEPDSSQSEKRSAKTAKNAQEAQAKSARAQDDDVIDVSPEDVEMLDK